MIKSYDKKPDFAVALLATLLAAATFREDLSATKVELFDIELTTLNLLVTIISILSLTLYFYALQHVFVNFSVFFNKLSKRIKDFADLLYIFAMSLPIIFLIAFILDSAIEVFGEQLIFLLTTLIGLGLINAIFILYLRYKGIQLEEYVQRLNTELSENMLDTTAYIKDALFGDYVQRSKVELGDKAPEVLADRLTGRGLQYGLIWVFKDLEVALKLKLTSEGYQTERTTMRKLSDFAVSEGLITKGERETIREGISLRNLAAHTGIDLDEVKARDTMKSIGAIIARIGD